MIKWEPLNSKFGSYIPLVMFITILDCRRILLETLFFAKFSFSRSNTLLDISQIWLVRLVWNEKEGPRLDTEWSMWPWPLTSPMTLTFNFSRSHFKIAVSLELLSDWCETKRKQINQIPGWQYGLALGLHPWPWPCSFKVKIWNSLIWGMGDGTMNFQWKKKVPWNGAVSMRSRAGSWETLSICITLRHNQGAPADMHANALGILIICRFPLA